MIIALKENKTGMNMWYNVYVVVRVMEGYGSKLFRVENEVFSGKMVFERHKWRK